MGNRNTYMGTGIDVEAIKARIAEQEAQRKAKLEETLAPLRKKMAEEKAGKEQAQADKAAQQAENLRRIREAEFDKLYRTPAELAYLATGGTKEDFAELWETRLREEYRVDVIAREMGRRQATAAKHVREAMSR